MKIFFEALFCIVLVISCSENKSKIPICEEAREIAKKDFKNGNYIYYEYQFLTDDKSSNKEFEEIFHKKGIKVIFKTKYPTSDIIVEEEPIEKSKKCYETMMNYQMEAKFGIPFFDSIRIEAKKTSKNEVKK